MHKLMEYICNELEEIEHKADKDGKLSMSEIEYADKLAHMKKNLLKAEEMWEDSEYSEEGRGSYARGGGRRGANQYGSYTMRGGRYSRDDSHMMVDELRDLMDKSPDEKTRMEFERFIRKIEQM